MNTAGGPREEAPTHTSAAGSSREDVVAEIARRAEAWSPPADLPIGLSGGSAGAALLFVELSKDDPALRPIAHARLAAAAKTIGSAPGSGGHGLYDGLAGLAFTIKAAVRAPGDYATVLGQLDTVVRDRLRHVLDLEQARMADGTEPAPRERFDVIGGASGLARYFLTEPADPEPVREVLRYLTALTEPIRRHGHTLPGWTATPWPGRETDGDQIDLGLGHGIAGPLALLSLCWTRGIRVPDQDTAVRRIADWLMSRRLTDDNGPYWPALFPAQEEIAGHHAPRPPHRPSWCYGAPGVARAMQLAGAALGEEEWVRSAADAMHAVHRRPGGLTDLKDPGLCHGLAGLAHITRVIATDLEDPVLTSHADALTERLCADFAPDTAFGYPTVTHPAPFDAPTFLEGAAGVALTLHRPGTPPHWDAALMLS
ncbi:lanthionine synthetase C family protein [Streptomyces hygroscopicus subsp. hygroscopicus]|uniref:lanthionine synthetase C family protein n=1 Tax=Streptomyces hygroscopicus TaxID=1912 RepID=UPI001C65F86A|nr:lanthionine synthetase C family protein [Streptomyces hygroscopicus]MBW8086986.1 lanthionine synthetase C family protein [Streptomyces hygroscopicus subsp. hygroscopicus]